MQGMVDLMVEAAILLSNSWESLLEHAGDNTEIVVDGDLRKFSADVISRACFGSSFADGKEIFSCLRKLQMVMSNSSMPNGIPGLRCCLICPFRLNLFYDLTILIEMFCSKFDNLMSFSNFHLTKVIQETLRLFPPAAFVVREALQSVKLGDIQLPKGITTWTTISMLHHDHNNWGADADEFNPDRFSRGIASACKFPHTYLPFGLGMRTCLGKAND
ncbi:cytochrome P450 714C2-like [Curcuma longa]|uniref:cytochrome P450 714C2-like n=1 Tax=Curcuma longa TaxID=136217 RepID=UPI003D9EE70F